MKFKSIIGIGNVANIGYRLFKILDRNGFDVHIYAHDEYHVMSQPEWVEAKPSKIIDAIEEKLPTAIGEKGYGIRIRKIFSRSDLLNYSSYPLDKKKISVIKKFIPRFIWNRIKIFTLFYFALKKQNFRKDSFFSIHREKEIFYSRASSLIKLIKIHDFPYNKITLKFLESYFIHMTWLKSIICKDDLLFCFAAHSIYPFLLGDVPYVAMEIGTIRGLSNPKNETDAILALSYLGAAHVFITNPDVKRDADLLGIKSYSFCPHPIDERIFRPISYTHRQKLRRKYIPIRDEEFIVFAPARQNWALKGNNKFFEAIAEIIKHVINVRVILPLWGQDIQRSKEKIKKLGIESSFIFLPPLPDYHMRDFIQMSDVVVDQFNLGVFGFISAKGLACGKIVLTSYAHEVNKWAFPVPPPVINVSSTKEIVEGLLFSLQKKNQFSFAKKSREWFMKYHSSKVVMACIENGIKAFK